MQNQNLHQTITTVLNLDKSISLYKENEINYALNAQVEATGNGNYYITNAYSNTLCFEYPENYELLNYLNLDKNEAVLFFKTPNSSEIGIFNNNTCTYKVWVNDPCLNFKNKINAVWKYNNICESRRIYFVDGINKDKYIDIDKPYPKKIINYDYCGVDTFTDELDCDNLLYFKDFKYPCISTKQINGDIPNGVYQIALAFSENKNIITDYIIYTDFDLYYENSKNGLEINIEFEKSNYTEYSLLLISNNANGNVIYNIGNYNINTKKINIYNLNNYEILSYSNLLINNSKLSISQDILVNNNSLLKIGLEETQQINYQPQANNIKSKWLLKRVPINDNSKTFPRDEIVPFFIRWFKKNGDYSCAYHIPNNTNSINNTYVNNKDIYESEINCYENKKTKYWEIYNTAKIKKEFKFDCNTDCEQIVAEGEFAQFESTELYPSIKYKYNDNDFTVFGDLSCKNILLHKFPDECIAPLIYKCDDCDNKKIFKNILGVNFYNIEQPKKLDGTYDDEYIGYQILTADRYGNETIISKGLIYNLAIHEELNEKIYFNNFPLNSLENNKFLSSTKVTNNFLGTGEVDFNPLNKYSQNDYSFYSPEYFYKNQNYTGDNFNIISEKIANIEAKIDSTYQHPKHQLLTNSAYLLATVLGTAIGVWEANTKKCKEVIEKADSCITGTVNGIPLTPTTPSSTNFTPSVVAISVSPSQISLTVDTNCAVTIAYTGNNAEMLALILQMVNVKPSTGNEIILNRVIPLTPNITLNTTDFKVICTDPTCCLPCTGVTVKNGVETKTIICEGILSKLPKIPVINFLIENSASLFYGLKGAKTVIDGFKAFLPYTNYAKQINILSEYENSDCSKIEQGYIRRKIEKNEYISNSNYLINNKKINNSDRESYYYLNLRDDLKNPSNIDTTGDLLNKFNCQDNYKSCNDTKNKIQSVAYYGAIKRDIKNPYGNLNNLSLKDISCVNYKKFNDNNLNYYSSIDVFGGDKYISKFTFKKIFNIFKNLPLQQNDDFILDYSEHSHIAYPRFWINTEPYEFQDLLEDGILNIGDNLPNDRYNLSCEKTKGFRKLGHFYTSVNAVVTFWTESNYNNNYRITNPLSPHYPKIDYNDIFRSDKSTIDNIFQINQEMQFNGFYKQNCFSQDFDVNKCSLNKEKIVYSLEDNKENKQDNWLIYPILNYSFLPKNSGNFTKIISEDNNNLILFFEDGVYVTQRSESLLTKNGSEIYIGEGDLYSRSLRKLSNDETGYLGCSDKRSIISNRHGKFWFDRKRKKIIKYTDRISEISQLGLNQWLQNFTDDVENNKDAVIGVYDNRFDTIYFTHNRTDKNCSWTLSYKEGLGWISFHSFIPKNYYICSNYFLSENKNGLWKHNHYKSKDIKSYQTYYNEKYPYIIGLPINNKNSANTLQSVDIKHETVKEIDFNNLQYNNKIFFNKFFVYSEYSNSGLQGLYIKNQENPYDSLRFLPNVNNEYLSNIRNLPNTNLPANQNNITDNYIVNVFSNNVNIGVPVTHIETNNWRINKFTNLAVNVPHIKNLCNGHSVELMNINYNLNPYKQGLIRGDFVIMYLINDHCFDHRFQTYFNLFLNDKIIK